MTRIGIIGTGWGARVQVPVFREAGLEVVAIAGHDGDKTRKAAEELRVRPFSSWHELIASDVDLVSIVTPPSEHLEMARAALAAGRHVICEKPTALNAAEAGQLVAAARAKPDRIALIDHELRFLPAWREARRRIPELGGVRYAEVRYASPSRGDRTRPWNWWSDVARGGGVLGAVGSHFSDSIRYLIGEIEAVQASLNTIVAERPLPPGEGRGSQARVTSDDFSIVNLRLTTGAIATMSMSAAASGPDEPTVITIHCEEAALRLEREELLFAKRGQPFERVAGNNVANRPGNSTGGAFGSGTYYFGLALHAAIDGGDLHALSPAATFQDGLAQQRVLDAARQSNQNGGGWVRIEE
jgi:predicted dehydrogenase